MKIPASGVEGGPRLLGAVGLEEIGERAQEARTVDLVLSLARLEIAGERRVAHAALTVGGIDAQLVFDVKTRDAGEL